MGGIDGGGGGGLNFLVSGNPEINLVADRPMYVCYVFLGRGMGTRLDPNGHPCYESDKTAYPNEKIAPLAA